MAQTKDATKMQEWLPELLPLRRSNGAAHGFHTDSLLPCHLAVYGDDYDDNNDGPAGEELWIREEMFEINSLKSQFKFYVNQMFDSNDISRTCMQKFSRQALRRLNEF